jgi:hypothetical protein
LPLLRAGGRRAGHPAAPEYVDEQAAGQYYRGGPEDGGRSGCRAGCARGYGSADDRGSGRQAGRDAAVGEPDRGGELPGTPEIDLKPGPAAHSDGPVPGCGILATSSGQADVPCSLVEAIAVGACARVPAV